MQTIVEQREHGDDDEILNDTSENSTAINVHGETPNDSHSSYFDEDAVRLESSSGGADNGAAHDINFNSSHPGDAMLSDSHSSSDDDSDSSDDSNAGDEAVDNSDESNDDSNDGDEAVVKHTKYPNGLYSSCFYVEFVPIFTKHCVYIFLSIALHDFVVNSCLMQCIYFTSSEICFISQRKTNQSEQNEFQRRHKLTEVMIL